MEDTLDYHQIQGNIMLNYGDYGFIKARYLFIRIDKVDHGMEFVKNIWKFITPASSLMESRLQDKVPTATTNIAFTFHGLQRLGLPALTLQSFPDEFVMGMNARRKILGDDKHSSPRYWDKIWQDFESIHIFVSMEARNQSDLENRYNDILKLIHEKDGIQLLDGHRCQVKGQTLPYQEASALYENGIPTPKEHFGYTDGISNPFFRGMTEDMGYLLGGGKKSGEGNLGYGDPELESTWAPLETGEFILGYRDEAGEYPTAPTPPLLSKNGSFMVYSKFHENVGKFNNYLKAEGAKFPGGEEALAAKFVGRWRNGAPLATYPNKEDADKIALARQEAVHQMVQAKDAQELLVAKARFKEVNKKFTAFDYEKDINGSRCPLGAHTRRANPRGSLEFGQKKSFKTPSALDDRRRIIRRGLPYGIANDPNSNEGEHGTIIMTIVASIKRQFEFVFQQWLNYGNDFKLANDKDPIVGKNSEVNGIGSGRMVVQGGKETDKETGEAPYFLSKIPRFVETRGGEYFFIPSLTALKMIGEGIVDPT